MKRIVVVFSILFTLVATSVFAGSETRNGGSYCQIEGQAPMLCELLVQGHYSGKLPYEENQRRDYLGINSILAVKAELEAIERAFNNRYGLVKSMSEKILHNQGHGFIAVFPLVDLLRDAQFYVVERFFVIDTAQDIPAELSPVQVAGAFRPAQLDPDTYTEKRISIIEINEARFFSLPVREQALLLLHESLHLHGMSHVFIYPFINQLRNVLQLHDEQLAGRTAELTTTELA